MKITSTSFTPKRKREIAIVGAGGIVKDAHLPAYKKAGYLVRAIHDTDYQKAQKLVNDFDVLNNCKSIDDLIKTGKENDCIYDIALPASEIIPILKKIPDEAGVLIQKPMGNNIQHAREILDICRKKKLTAGINFQLRHAPYIIKAREIIAEGLIGDLHDIDVRVNVLTPWHLWSFLYGLPRMEILYNSIHYIDMVRYFLGNPQAVYAKTTKHPKMMDLASTRSSIILDYGDVIRANINTNHGHEFGIKHQESYFKFEGTKGAIKVTAGLNLNYPEGLPDEFEYISLEDSKGWRKVEIEGSWFPDAFIGPMGGLMCKLENQNYKYVNSVEDAIYTMEVVEQCYICSDQLRGK
ncbi:MAG: Gfo/Idh/MocA family oxidoreductase [Fulvivirga sp.]|uniref:Gfo/Idh/MocA family protein n=1 Tax=Fulvivirga sp. TaxID=1931237 RepID=UPI0032EAF825